jgi:hypothetical protein
LFVLAKCEQGTTRSQTQQRKSATSPWACGQRKSVAHMPTATTTEENS